MTAMARSSLDYDGDNRIDLARILRVAFDHKRLIFTITILFALLGVKAPPQAEIEHDEMRRLAKLLFGRDGRRDLNTETDGLEAYIEKWRERAQG